MDTNPPEVIVPPPPETRTDTEVLRAKVAELEAVAADQRKTIDALTQNALEKEAERAGADQARAAAQLERDAARLALDARDFEPCTVCGKQRKDTP